VDIYSDQMIGMTDSLLRDLSRVVCHQGHSYIICQRPWRLEAALSNVLSRATSVVLESGRFANRLGQRRSRHGAEVEVLKATGAARYAGEVEARLRLDKDQPSRRSSQCRSTRVGRHQRHQSHRQGIKAAGHRRCSWSMR